jgi:negative regulator of flagellin synthesis FlgM
MSNPIDGINTANPVTIVTTGEAGATPAAEAAAKTGAVAPVDQADVGGTEALLMQIADAANGVPNIDEAKVSTLRQQIAAGTYQIDPQQIAEKMMQLDAGLGAGGGKP